MNLECSQLLLRVFDADDDRDDLVAFSSIPITNLMEGFRTVLLYDKSGSRNGDMVFATLFVRINMTKLQGDVLQLSEMDSSRKGTRRRKSGV